MGIFWTPGEEHIHGEIFPKYENIINSGDGLQLLSIGIRCRWNNSMFDRVRQSLKYDQVSFETYNTRPNYA